MSRAAEPAPRGYEDALCRFCQQSALFEHYSRCREHGISVSERDLAKAARLAKESGEDLAIEKQNLGFDDGFDFFTKPLYSNRGFELVNQRLTGRIDNVVPVLASWREVDKVTEKNHFKYEQATLALSHYYMQTGQSVCHGAGKIRRQVRLIEKAVRRERLLAERDEDGGCPDGSLVDRLRRSRFAEKVRLFRRRAFCSLSGLFKKHEKEDGVA